MRELTKSVVSFSWAMSLFGLKQAANLLVPQTWDQATSAMKGVAGATEGQLGPTLQSLYRAGDNMQKGMVDMMFGMVGLGAWNPAAWDPTGMVRSSVDVVRQSAQAGADLVQRSAEVVGQAVPGGSTWGTPPQVPSGWGPVGK